MPPVLETGRLVFVFWTKPAEDEEVVEEDPLWLLASALELPLVLGTESGDSATFVFGLGTEGGPHKFVLLDTRKSLLLTGKM
jgi:hypothetical protein